MGKTIRSPKSRAHTEHDSFEHQMLKVKKVIVSNKADDFMRDFHITEYTVDTIFPNRDKETAKEYTRRNIENYTVVIFHIKELITVLADPLSGRPVTSEFNWVLNAIEHRVEIDDDLVNTMTTMQKGDLLQKLLEESEIRLTMLQSIPVPLSLISPTLESEVTMNANATTSTTTADEINDVINTAATNGAKHVEQAAQATTDAVKPVVEKVAEAVADAAEKASSKPAEETPKEAPKPEVESAKIGWKKVAKYASITVATIGAVAGGYWLYKNKFAGSIGGVVTNAADVASEQVVGG